MQTALESPPFTYGGDASGNWSRVRPNHHNEWNFIGERFFVRNRAHHLMLRIGFIVRGSDSQAVSYSFCVNNLTALGGPTNSLSAPDGQLLEPDEVGWVDRTKTGDTGIQGWWYAYGDNIDGACERAGYAKSECSIVSEPAPDAPTYSPTPGLGMCTSGVVGRIVGPGIYGAGIGFNPNVPDSGGPAQEYNAPAHRVGGFAFDLEPEPTGDAEIGVHVDMQGGTQAYWPDAVGSLVHAGRNEFWLDDLAPGVGGNAAVIYPTRLMGFNLLVSANSTHRASYSFCIKNFTALRN